MAYDINIKREMTTMFFLTDNATYTIETQENRRVVAFENGEQVWGTTTQYNILFGNEVINFCYDEDMIATQIADFEGNGDNIDPIYFTGITNG